MADTEKKESGYQKSVQHELREGCCCCRQSFINLSCLEIITL